VVISADCHGGAQLHEYRDYLEQCYHDAFDDWARDHTIPYEELTGDEGRRNWDSARRLADLESDGIVAEVVFPNTIPPFFQRRLAVQMPGATERDRELRWAGLRAHNRWLVDFCAAARGRRAGVAQIMLYDLDAAVREVRWAAKAGLTGGVLLPGTPPASGLDPLYSPVYEPLWRACEEAALPLNHHGGSGVPPLGDQPVDNVMFLLEVEWWAHRALWHLIFGGVLERHPELQLVFTEQGTSWIPETLGTLDHFFSRMGSSAGSQEEEWGAEVVGKLSLRPSEYWARQCHVGSTFMRPTEATLRHTVGIDKIMWASDYPHKESSFPFSRAALRRTFAGIDAAEVQQMVGGNAASLYRFDMGRLAGVANRVGPTHDEIDRVLPVEEIPAGAARCPAFD
jgi:predicted TIM-barrel fold metal-dependent hydrolase